MRIQRDIFTAEEIVYIRQLHEVQESYRKTLTQANVYFNIPLTQTIQDALQRSFQLDLSTKSTIPCRWIKGDTSAHVDRGQEHFETTYLVYLTDSEGIFQIEDQQYPIEAGTGFSFSEGLSHEVTGTQGTTRLLLGPMSEQGFAVGGPTTSISLDPGQTAYIREASGILEYSYDQVTWDSIIIGSPVFVENTNPSGGIVYVKFITNITITDLNTTFTCNSDGIQFGSTSLEPGGSRPVITISGTASPYRGLIINGFPFTAYNNITIYNLVVDGSASVLDDGFGWIGQQQFGQNASDNYIINCASIGDISLTSGGIVGQNAGSAGSLTIRGCSSSGLIGEDAGGIAGKFAGFGSGSITCELCWSTGVISGNNAGGIFGKESGSSGGNATATKCYSTGIISGINAGGIFGQLVASDGLATANSCYSQGDVTESTAGGIYGSGAASDGGTTNATNCYSAGTLSTGGNGIYSGGSGGGRNQTNCYIANGSWSSIAANSALTGVPSPTVGTTWVATTMGQPYELNGMGYTPYSVAVINSSSQLIQSFSQSVAAGSSSGAAIVSGKSYSILDKSGGDPGSYGTITINSTSGAISTTSATVPGTYTLYIRNLGSYNITQVLLTITAYSPEAIAAATQNQECCAVPMNLTNAAYTERYHFIAGNYLIGSTSPRRQAYTSYADLYNKKMAYAAKR